VNATHPVVESSRISAWAVMLPLYDGRDVFATFLIDRLARWTGAASHRADPRTQRVRLLRSPLVQ
jgi:hypothetical protein